MASIIVIIMIIITMICICYNCHDCYPTHAGIDAAVLEADGFNLETAFSRHWHLIIMIMTKWWQDDDKMMTKLWQNDGDQNHLWMPGSLFPRVKHYVSPSPGYLTPAHNHHYHDNYDDHDHAYHDILWWSTHLSYCLTGHRTLRVVPTYTVARPPTLSFTTCAQKGVKTFAGGMFARKNAWKHLVAKKGCFIAIEITETGVQNHLL